MSIQIKSIGGRVLYTAETAADVREALREAVLQGADLQGADLRGAYLQGADLQGADLQGAYLQGADLRGADLRGAYLQGADLQGAYLQGADLQGAYLQGAYLQGADLQGAYLRGAYLRGAYLRGAYLRGAYLRGADLQGADLRGAYLRGARGLLPHQVQPLLMLHDQVGKIRAYKMVDSKGRSPVQSSGKLTYEKGKTYEVPDANTDPSQDCGAGINVSTLPWIFNEGRTWWKPGHRVMVVEFTAKDIACIPLSGDKFRLFRCKVVGEKNLAEIGLVESPLAEPDPQPEMS